MTNEANRSFSPDWNEAIRTVKNAIHRLEKETMPNEAMRPILEAQWGVALKLWTEEYEFWSAFHKRSLVLGGAKQSDEVFTETVYERIGRVLPMRVRKEKIDLRSAVEVLSDADERKAE